MTQNLPIGNYKFVKYFNRNRYLNSDYSCLLNFEIYASDKVRNNSMLKQFPALTLASPDLLGTFYDHVDDKVAQL